MPRREHTWEAPQAACGHIGLPWQEQDPHDGIFHRHLHVFADAGDSNPGIRIAVTGRLCMLSLMYGQGAKIKVTNAAGFMEPPVYEEGDDE